MGSVKDRLSPGVIVDAERRSEPKLSQTVVDATSGNNGNCAQLSKKTTGRHCSRFTSAANS
jgi:cysteine synthase